ncbi:MAG: hypothetical protein BHW56_02490 [Acetobacter sp. 46_36]|nr:MAG: hypothetical protein BHW56_02490 [Acetobacter sp. 46_36]
MKACVRKQSPVAEAAGFFVPGGEAAFFVPGGYDGGSCCYWLCRGEKGRLWLLIRRKYIWREQRICVLRGED